MIGLRPLSPKAKAYPELELAGLGHPAGANRDHDVVGPGSAEGPNDRGEILHVPRRYVDGRSVGAGPRSLYGPVRLAATD